MVKEIICAIDQHKLWVDSLGEKGEKVNLEEKVIEGEEWENINLSQASIVDCVFKGIVIKNWDFYAAILCSTCFEKAWIRSSGFVKANLDYTEFNNTKIQSTNFSKTELINAVFKNVELIDVKFINSILENTEFLNMKLKNVDFTGALIEGTKFNNIIILGEILGLEEAFIKSVNIGTRDEPIYLKEGEAVLYIKNIMRK